MNLRHFAAICQPIPNRRTPASTGPRIRQRPLARLLLAVAIVVLALMQVGPVEASGPPEVNGWFYGDGDSDSYVAYATSEYGSKLYVAYDSPTIYVALVVDRSVNDNVFARKQDEGAYMASAGWSGRHDAAQLINSEYASFSLRCAEAPLVWTWQQGYGRLVGGTWVSDAGGAGGGTPPPSYTSASSFAHNINTWNAAATKPWDMMVNGSSLGDWKSPFDGRDPNTVVGLEGYPATGAITFSPTYMYEWAMVYEWSVDLEAAGCGDDPLYFVAGASHHSPLKSDGADENDDFPAPSPEDQIPFYDFGDLPDSYGTLKASDGAAHMVTVNGARLGRAPDIELDGQASAGAAGDDGATLPDEDGVSRQRTSPWDPGDTVKIDFDVQGTTPTADIAMWLDWNGDGDFDDPDEYRVFRDRPVGRVATEGIFVPMGYVRGRTLNARVRIVSDETAAPGGALDAGDYVGIAGNGEVEDYQWIFSPTAVALSSLEGSPAPNALLSGGVALLLPALVLAWRTGGSRRRRDLG